MVPTGTSDDGARMGENSVRLTRSSGAGGRSSWSATDAERGREHPRNILIAGPDLARDPGLLCGTPLLGVDVTGQASRAVSRGTFDSSVPSREIHPILLADLSPPVLRSERSEASAAHGGAAIR